jgi:hypothetical protein
MTHEQRELYRERFAGMDQEEIMELLGEWSSDCGCEAACPNGCWVEPDGTCSHGAPSWLLALGMI